MCASSPKSSPGTAAVGLQIHSLMAELFPICRSRTGNGIRQTLEILRRHVPLKVHEVATGIKVFDWTVPKEWNIRDAYIKDPGGRKVVDFQRSNLHVASYSIPVKARMSLTELKKRLFTLPAHPDWVPYKTLYHDEDWAFCMSHNQVSSLEEGEYDTVAGLVLDRLERIPLPGERVREEGAMFEIAAAEPQRVLAVRLTLIDGDEESEKGARNAAPGVMR